MKKTNEKPSAELSAAGNAAEFETLLRSGMDDLMAKTGSHQDAWGLGQEEQWFLDEGSAELIFTFPDLAVSASAQVIGTWEKDTGKWTWAWALPSFPEHLQVDALKVKEYGVQHGFHHLCTASWTAEESHCWYMTALACWLFQADGAYRGETGNTCTFMIFREVASNSMAESEGEASMPGFMNLAVEEFRQCESRPEAQREACCRYLKRGALEGIDQPELIHQLGLATPSVLDLAGYSTDAAQSVMDLLKTISDEEIDTSPQSTSEDLPASLSDLDGRQP